MATLFGYSLISVVLIMFAGRNLSRTARLQLMLLALVLLNGPGLLTLLFSQ
ncbi:MAG: hypothetical protein OEV12_00275 [Gammaproteobacteria bacterium]|jgi:hypothetical protein|nr:hypothetical protein [Gammaproteobacteria bacterium]MDH3984832.1 hypothetical protein [Gammaproteobacteria bacterium]